MKSRGILWAGLAVVLCLLALPLVVGCGDKTTAPAPAPSGACCNAAGGCSVVTQASCGGSWMGGGTVCAPNPCQQLATGACCNATGGCSVTLQAACGGNWQGANTACAPNPCVSTTTGTITGTASLPIGTPGDISNTLVSIYSNYDDWNGYRPLRSVQSTYISPSNFSFTFTNVTPGTYYLDCWKDNDISGRWSVGDFLGVYGSTVWPGMTPAPLSVAGGQTTNVTVIVIGI